MSFDEKTFATQAPDENDAQIDAALAALGQVQPPVYMKQRLAARLAQEPITSGKRLHLQGWVHWLALGSVAAGCVLMLALHPSHTPGVAPAAPVPASAAAQPANTPAAQPDVHPGFVAQQRQTRGALNANGVVATAHARTQNNAEEAAARKPGGHRKTHEAKASQPVSPAGAPSPSAQN